MDNDCCGLCHDEIVQQIRNLKIGRELTMNNVNLSSLSTFDSSDFYEFDANIKEVKASYDLGIKRLTKKLSK